jgi:hypothetical protein
LFGTVNCPFEIEMRSLSDMSLITPTGEA